MKGHSVEELYFFGLFVSTLFSFGANNVDALKFEKVTTLNFAVTTDRADDHPLNSLEPAQRESLCNEGIAKAREKKIRVREAEAFEANNASTYFFSVKYRGAANAVRVIAMACHDNPLIVIIGDNPNNYKTLVKDDSLQEPVNCCC